MSHKGAGTRGATRTDTMILFVVIWFCFVALFKSEITDRFLCFFLYQNTNPLSTKKISTMHALSKGCGASLFSIHNGVVLCLREAEKLVFSFRLSGWILGMLVMNFGEIFIISQFQQNKLFGQALSTHSTAPLCTCPSQDWLASACLLVNHLNPDL